MIDEKTLIKTLIRPLFNPSDDPFGVGDDCAMIRHGEVVLLVSTDRIPSDLIAFKYGILNYFGLGDYLARLNLSDIAACGGSPLGLLLNMGLPSGCLDEHVRDICNGFASCASRHGTTVLGGDITSSKELSLSATSIGSAPSDKVLTRRGAAPGDSVFISRPIGVTPAAIALLQRNLLDTVSSKLQNVVARQFVDIQPMLDLGIALRESGQCGACMDNTDGVGQSLSELAEASGVCMVINDDLVKFSPEMVQICNVIHVDPMSIAFNGGADFSLIGTLRGSWTTESAKRVLGPTIEIIGNCEHGSGVSIENAQGRKPLAFNGWNYFNQDNPA